MSEERVCPLEDQSPPNDSWANCRRSSPFSVSMELTERLLLEGTLGDDELEHEHLVVAVGSECTCLEWHDAVRALNR